ncbi:MAG: ribose 5-phosphate isomerase B [Alistipes sp.]|nr:ribose 5-phosphate isomerase B [Alistipes sp.]
MKIGIACDHAGYEMKEFLTGLLAARGHEVFDFGTQSAESVDYPDFAHQLAESVESGQTQMGVGLCGSGEGMAITLNKHAGIRAALCWSPEIAELTRRHNDANVVVLPARFIDNDTAAAIVDAFLAGTFEGGRHAGRVAKIPVPAK